MVASTHPAAQSPSDELVITRLFDAPPARVFDAWVHRDQLAAWFGPSGYTAEVGELDPRPGGTYHAILREGETEHPLHGTFREVVAGERLVLTHQWDDGKSPETECVVTFVEHEGGAKSVMTFRQTGFATRTERDGHEDGWTQTFDKLAELLAAG